MTPFIKTSSPAPELIDAVSIEKNYTAHRRNAVSVVRDPKNNLVHVDYSMRLSHSQHDFLQLLPEEFVNTVNRTSATARETAQDMYSGLVKGLTVEDPEKPGLLSFETTGYKNALTCRVTLDPMRNYAVADQSFRRSKVKLKQATTYSEVNAQLLSGGVDPDIELLRKIFLVQKYGAAHVERREDLSGFSPIGQHLMQTVQGHTPEFALEKDLNCIHRRKNPCYKPLCDDNFISTKNTITDQNWVTPVVEGIGVPDINKVLITSYLDNSENLLSPETVNALVIMARDTQKSLRREG